jgi:hypothetical protein
MIVTRKFCITINIAEGGIQIECFDFNGRGLNLLG